MEVHNTPLLECFYFKPRIFSDERGEFFESFHHSKFREKFHFNFNFVQDNQATSRYGVIRGLHFQTGEFAQSKLIRVLHGRILDVVVDLREESPSFGKSFSLEISKENNFQLYIPKSFAHGYSVLEENATVLYKCDAFYNPKSEAGIQFDDPYLAIDWKVPKEKQIISERDLNWQSFKEFKQSL